MSEEKNCNDFVVFVPNGLYLDRLFDQVLVDQEFVSTRNIRKNTESITVPTSDQDKIGAIQKTMDDYEDVVGYLYRAFLARCKDIADGKITIKQPVEQVSDSEDTQPLEGEE
jgi:hypothetical protein